MMQRENFQGTYQEGAAWASVPQPVYDMRAGVRRLTQAGMEESLAEAVVSEQLRIVGQNVVIHADSARPQHDIMRSQQDLRGEIRTLQGTVEALGHKTEGSRQATRADIMDARINLLLWGTVQSMFVVLVVVMLV